MALVSVSEKCFNTIESALKAMKMGDIRTSEVLLKSLGKDGFLVQEQASVYCGRLREAQDEHKRQVEAITQQINKLYQEQKQHEKRQKEIEANKSSLTGRKNQYIQSKQEALEKCQEAERKKREAEEKHEELKTYWWVPIYGDYLIAREIFEENSERAKAASRNMASYERDAEEAELVIEWANSGICQAEEDMQRISEKVEQLKRQRKDRQNELGDIKSMVAFIQQAIFFWNDVVELTRAATVKTENIQKIVERARKEDSVRILTSRGTQIKMKSFKECWMDLVQTINSDENNVIFQKKGMQKLLFPDGAYYDHKKPKEVMNTLVGMMILMLVMTTTKVMMLMIVVIMILMTRMKYNDLSLNSTTVTVMITLVIILIQMLMTTWTKVVIEMTVAILIMMMIMKYY